MAWLRGAVVLGIPNLPEHSSFYNPGKRPEAERRLVMEELRRESGTA
jgi:hypothetical protein